jgi:ketopantoate reductase
MGRLSALVGAPNRLVRKVMAWQAGRSAEAPLSMRQDVLKKRGRTEIDHINGAVAREGERLGVDVRANNRLCEMVRNAGAAK